MAWVMTRGPFGDGVVDGVSPGGTVVGQTRAARQTPRVGSGSAAGPGPRDIWLHALRASAGRCLLAFLLVCMACGVTDEGDLPPDVQDPTSVQTPTGAVRYYQGVLLVLPRELFGNLLYQTALMTDEVGASPVLPGEVSRYTLFDTREDFVIDLYRKSHRLRAEARQARAFLGAYAADSSPALRGHMYTMEAYAELFLADNYCSGIPLSTVDFQGDYTLAAGSTTMEVYTSALAFLDSAVALTGDSVQLQHLAAVGRGRALLGLGRYAEAAAAVTAVPDDYTYQVTPASDSGRLFIENLPFGTSDAFGLPGMADREGGVGLDYISSGDPRTATVLAGQDNRGNNIYFPAKYPVNGTYTYVLASGVEARLIEAEAALQAGSGTWLTTLNLLRQAVGLADTTDPGTEASRVDLLFRERAFWLYMTGHRQGDLRRLVRQYLRAPATVYPMGAYSGASGQYSPTIVVPVPERERELNPKYTGCFHSNA